MGCFALTAQVLLSAWHVRSMPFIALYALSSASESLSAWGSMLVSCGLAQAHRVAMLLAKLQLKLTDSVQRGREHAAAAASTHTLLLQAASIQCSTVFNLTLPFVLILDVTSSAAACIAVDS